MRFLKSGFLWQFVGGFALGAVGVLGFHSADAGTTANPPATAAHVSR